MLREGPSWQGPGAAVGWHRLRLVLEALGASAQPTCGSGRDAVDWRPAHHPPQVQSRVSSLKKETVDLNASLQARVDKLEEEVLRLKAKQG